MMQNKSKKKIWTLLVCFLFFLPYLWICISDFVKYLHVKDDFQKTCEYIKVNEQAFVDFSEYTISLLSENNCRVDINAMDIWNNHIYGQTVHAINCYIAYSTVYSDDTKGTVYVIRNSFGYIICIVYKKGGSLSATEIGDFRKGEYYIINDNLYAYFIKDYSGHA